MTDSPTETFSGGDIDEVGRHFVAMYDRVGDDSDRARDVITAYSKNEAVIEQRERFDETPSEAHWESWDGDRGIDHPDLGFGVGSYTDMRDPGAGNRHLFDVSRFVAPENYDWIVSLLSSAHDAWEEEDVDASPIRMSEAAQEILVALAEQKADAQMLEQLNQMEFASTPEGNRTRRLEDLKERIAATKDPQAFEKLLRRDVPHDLPEDRGLGSRVQWVIGWALRRRDEPTGGVRGGLDGRVEHYFSAEEPEPDLRWGVLWDVAITDWLAEFEAPWDAEESRGALREALSECPWLDLPNHERGRVEAAFEEWLGPEPVRAPDENDGEEPESEALGGPAPSPTVAPLDEQAAAFNKKLDDLGF